MDCFRLIADRKIEEAMEEGAFEDLQGAGRPLTLEEDPFKDPSLRMAHRLLRNNGFAPGWILEAKEIEAGVGRLRSDAACGRLAAGEFRRRAVALNRRIADFNLRAPSLSVHKVPLDIDRECGKLEAAR